MNEQKLLWRQGNIQGGALLIYKAIMIAAVVAAMLVSVISQLVQAIAANQPIIDEATAELLLDMEAATEFSSWGYVPAVIIGLAAMMIWKKPFYFRDTLCQRGRAMTVGDFFALLSFFLSGQLIYQGLSAGAEWLANGIGFSVAPMLESVTGSSDSAQMFLYVCLLAPISEELLFRGLLLRSLEPWGKKFAIVTSAILFGLYHGHPLQAPFAFYIGLVLGYVTAEHNILWAMVLHMVNNLLLADSLPRIMASFPAGLETVVLWMIMIVSGIAALTITIVRWKDIQSYCRQEGIERWKWFRFWTSPCVLLLAASSVVDMVIVTLMCFD